MALWRSCAIAVPLKLIDLIVVTWFSFVSFILSQVIGSLETVLIEFLFAAFFEAKSDPLGSCRQIKM